MWYAAGPPSFSLNRMKNNKISICNTITSCNRVKADWVYMGKAAENFIRFKTFCFSTVSATTDT